MKFAPGTPSLYGSSLLTYSGLVSMPSDDSGSSGSSADLATESANGRLRSNSFCTSASSSGKTNPQSVVGQPSPSSGVHASAPVVACA